MFFFQTNLNGRQKTTNNSLVNVNEQITKHTANRFIFASQIDEKLNKWFITTQLNTCQDKLEVTKKKNNKNKWFSFQSEITRISI